MNIKLSWNDFGRLKGERPDTNPLDLNRIIWKTEYLGALLKQPAPDEDWRQYAEEEFKVRSSEWVGARWKARTKFPVVLAFPAEFRNQAHSKARGTGLLLWLSIEGTGVSDLRAEGEQRQTQKDILNDLHFETEAVEGILSARRFANGGGTLLRKEVGPSFADIGSRIEGQSASLAVAAWLTWHKRHLWPSKPLVITGELTKDGKVKSVEKLKEKLAAAKDRGVDFLVTPGEPGAKDPEGLIKVPGEGLGLEDWLEACEKRLREQHVYLTHSWVSRSFLVKKRKGFIGRQWLRLEIEEWSKTKPDERGLLLLGKPGSGKSSFVADLVLREEWEPRILACHICRHDRAETCNANNLITQLAGMLSDSLPAFRRQREIQRHQDVSGGLNTSGSTSDHLERELLTPLRGLENFDPGHTCYLVVDGLDESLNSDGNEDLGIPQFLEQVAEALPAWLRVIATSRPVGDVTRSLPWSVRQLAEGENESHNRQDLTDYLNEQLKKPTLNEKLREQLRNSTLTTNQAVQPLFEKSKGNFLYLKEALNGLEKGWYQWDKIPDDLAGIYLGYFKRLFNSKSGLEHYNDNVEPLLSLVVEAKAPLSALELGEILNRRKKDVEADLDPLESYVDPIEDRYEIYHGALKDWLAGRVSSERKHDRHPFVVDTEESRESLTQWCFTQFNNKEAKMSNYARRHLIAHLVDMQRWDDVRTVLTSYEFLRERVERGETAQLISDCELVASVRGAPVQGFAKLLGGAMRLSEEALRDDRSHLPSQLVGRLLDASDPDIQLLLADVTIRARKPWLRPRTEALISPGGPLYCTLRGHTGPVYSVAVTSDGHRAISGSRDGTIKVWDLRTGAPTRTLKHSDRMISVYVAITPDGRRAVSGAHRRLKVWDLETNGPPRTLKCPEGMISCLTLTPDGRQAVSTSVNGAIDVWDLVNDLPLRRLESCTGRYISVSLADDGEHVISASQVDFILDVADLKSGALLQVGNLRTGAQARTINLIHQMNVTSVAVTSAGNRAVSASCDKTLKVWDLETGDLLRTLEGHSASVNGVSMTPDGRLAVSGSADKTLKVWDLETGDVLRTLEGHSASVNWVSMTPNGRCAVSASEDHTLKVWDLESLASPRSHERHTAKVTSLSLTPDGRRAVSASLDKTLKVWDLETGALLRTIEGHADAVTIVAITPDGNHAVSVSHDNTVRVWNLKTDEVPRVLKCHHNIGREVGGPLVVCSTLKIARELLKGMLKLVYTTLKTERGQPKLMLNVLDLNGGPTRVFERGRCVALTTDGRRAVSGSSGNTLNVWDLETGERLLILKGHKGPVRSVALTPDGCRAVSGSDDKTLKVWDLKTGDLLRTLEGHSASVTSVSVSSDGHRAVSGSCDKTVVVWDLVAGNLTQTLKGHTGRVGAILVTPDGRRVVSKSDDKSLKLWDLHAGRMIGSFEADASMTVPVCSSDGRQICAGDELGNVHILHLESTD